MKIVEYDALKEKIDDKYKNGLNIEIYLQNKKEILSKLFKYEEFKSEIDYNKIIPINDNNFILEFKDVDKNEINTVIVKENKPVFRMKHYDSNNFIYNLNTYYIYDEEGYLENRICIEEMLNITNIKLLQRNNDTRIYNKREYTFYKNFNDIIAFKANNKMNLRDEFNFNSKLINIINEVSDFYFIINNKVDNLLGYDIVKEYVILRKDKKQEN